VVFISYKQRQDEVDQLTEVGMNEKEASKKAVRIVEDGLFLNQRNMYTIINKN
jgi:hypothetical protein